MLKKNRLDEEGFRWDVVHNDTKSFVEQSLLLYSEEIWRKKGLDVGAGVRGLDLGCGLTDLTRCNIRAGLQSYNLEL